MYRFCWVFQDEKKKRGVGVSPGLDGTHKFFPISEFGNVYFGMVSDGKQKQNFKIWIVVSGLVLTSGKSAKDTLIFMVKKSLMIGETSSVYGGFVEADNICYSILSLYGAMCSFST